MFFTFLLAAMKCALQDISAGHLDNVLKRIQDKQLELNANSALKLVICCCTVCSKNEHQIPIRSLCTLIEICSTHIKQPNETELTNYLQSLYYILKYLLEKVNKEIQFAFITFFSCCRTFLYCHR